MRFLKDAAKRVIAALPEGLRIGFLKLMAAMPPRMRTRLGYRLAIIVSGYTKTPFTVTTSMGISHRYRCEVMGLFDPHISWGKPQFNENEWHTMLLAGFFSQQCSCFIDIGSYAGYYVFYVRSVVPETKPIYFFEPVPEYFEQIQSNVNRNRLKNTIGFCQAVGETTGSAVFYRNITHESCGSLTDRYVDKHITQMINVKVTTFDNFVDAYNLDNICVKIDIEGAEALFLRGATTSLDRVKYMLIEVLDSQSQFLRDMVSRGLYVYHITAEGLTFCAQGTDRYINGQWNWLICQLDPQSLQETIRPIGLHVIQQATVQS